MVIKLSEPINSNNLSDSPMITDPAYSAQKLLQLAKEAEKQAAAAETAAQNAVIAAKAATSTLGECSYPKELILQAKIEAAQKAEYAARSAIEAQNAACEATLAALKTTENEMFRHRVHLDEVQAQFQHISDLAEEAEERSQDAIDQAALAAKMADTEEKRSYAYKISVMAAKIMLEEAQKKTDGAQENYIQAQKKLVQTQSHYQALEKSAQEEKVYFENLLTQTKQELSLESVQSLSPETEETPTESVQPAVKVEKTKPTYSKGRVVWEYVKIIILAFAVAIILRTYVFEMTKVDGVSMEPTLQNGDALFALKINYLIGEPERGDIVILEAPDRENEYYIKRVIGLPNEHIVIKDGLVYINDQMLPEPYLNNILTQGNTDLIIPSNSYFVVGDNRNQSHDSRSPEVGTIVRKDIIGQAIYRVYPFDHISTLE